MTAVQTSPERPIVLVGAGKMGGALAAGWLDGGADPASIIAIDPAPNPDILSRFSDAGVAVHATPPSGLVAGIVVLAVKPQVMRDALPALRSLIGDDTTVLSIAAGTTLADLEAGLGEGIIVRSMPNTPAQVGRGITVCVGNANVGEAERDQVSRLLGAVGRVAWVDDEALIDAVTAVSGSGPAYVFLLAEAMAEAGIAVGLPEDLALDLARATVTGAGELLHRSDLSPSTLRENVTSPGGTTAAALAELMAEDGLSPLMTRAVAAAKKRSEDLSG